eukprot:1177063-Prorocentrum_minimum.AAC.1
MRRNLLVVKDAPPASLHSNNLHTTYVARLFFSHLRCSRAAVHRNASRHHLRGVASEAAARPVSAAGSRRRAPPGHYWSVGAFHHPHSDDNTYPIVYLYCFMSETLWA